MQKAASQKTSALLFSHEHTEGAEQRGPVLTSAGELGIGVRAAWVMNLPLLKQDRLLRGRSRIFTGFSVEPVPAIVWIGRIFGNEIKVRDRAETLAVDETDIAAAVGHGKVNAEHEVGGRIVDAKNAVVNLIGDLVDAAAGKRSGAVSGHAKRVMRRAALIVGGVDCGLVMAIERRHSFGGNGVDHDGA